MLSYGFLFSDGDAALDGLDCPLVRRQERRSSLRAIVVRRGIPTGQCQGYQRRGTRTPRLVHYFLLVAAMALGACSGKDQGPARDIQWTHAGGVQAAAQPAAAPTLTPELIARNDNGVALMGQFDYQAAYDLFAKLVAEQPDWLAAKVNLAIAQLNLNRPGSDDLATAQRLLREVVAADPADLRAHYCLGILLLNGGEIPAALEQFQHVAKADPGDGFVAYFLARCLFEQDKFAEALTWYRTAVQSDPLLQSAYYGEFQTLQRLGKPDEAKPLLAAFERLAKNPQAEKADIKYTRMGPKAMAATVDLNPLPPVQRPAGPPFADVVPLQLTLPTEGELAWAGGALDPPPTITVCDIDGDGRPDLFISGALVQGGKRLNAVLLRRDHGYELDTQHPLAHVTDVNAVLWETTTTTTG